MIGKNKSIILLACLSIVTALVLVGVVSAQVAPPRNDVIVNVIPDSQTGSLGGILTYNINLTNNVIR